MTAPHDVEPPTHGQPVDLPIVVLTGRSMWAIEPTRYLRIPRCDYTDRPANNTPSVENRLEDRVWHDHHGATWEEIGGEFRIRIKPDAGPTDGFGVVTGLIEIAYGLG